MKPVFTGIYSSGPIYRGFIHRPYIHVAPRGWGILSEPTPPPSPVAPEQSLAENPLENEPGEEDYLEDIAVILPNGQAEQPQVAEDTAMDGAEAPRTPDPCPAAQQVRISVEKQAQIDKKRKAAHQRSRLDGDQRAAVKQIEGGLSMFLSGNAGAGKSLVLEVALESLKRKGRDVAVTGTTGQAAEALDGFTLHTWSCISPSARKSDLEQPIHDGKKHGTALAGAQLRYCLLTKPRCSTRNSG